MNYKCESLNRIVSNLENCIVLMLNELTRRRKRLNEKRYRDNRSKEKKEIDNQKRAAYKSLRYQTDNEYKNKLIIRGKTYRDNLSVDVKRERGAIKYDKHRDEILIKIKIKNSTRFSRIRPIRASIIKNEGGRCVSCGFEYNGKNGAVFHFHHKDPSNKLFEIAGEKLLIQDAKIIQDEVDKCLLLCANCHAILHSTEY